MKQGNICPRNGQAGSGEAAAASGFSSGAFGAGGAGRMRGLGRRGGIQGRGRGRRAGRSGAGVCARTVTPQGLPCPRHRAQGWGTLEW